MNIIARVATVAHWLVRFTQVQLFITLVSFPLLVYRGLPLSVMSPVGNLVFTPFLMVFLLLCSLLFFCHILYFPYGWLVYALEHVTQFWLWVLSWGSQSWLIGFSKPSLLFLLAMPLFALLILQHNKTNSLYRSIICFTLLLFCSCTYLKVFCPPPTALQQVTCNKKDVTLLHTREQTILIDPGLMGQRISYASWIDYTLLSELIKTTGRTTIETVIALQPGTLAFRALEHLCTKAQVQKIYIVWWDGSLTKSGWRAYFNLKRTCEQHGVRLLRMGNKKITVDSTLTIEPLEYTIKQQKITYPALYVHGACDGHEVAVYSNKYPSSPRAMSGKPSPAHPAAYVEVLTKT